MDGAEWEQGFVNLHCDRAVRILDLPMRRNEAARSDKPCGKATPASSAGSWECPLPSVTEGWSAAAGPVPAGAGSG
jgi:hypothetical protein